MELVSLVLAGDNGERKPVQRPLKLDISGVQASTDRYAHGKIEIYDMNLTAKIPTEFQGSYLIYQILSNEREALIVSPNGGVAHPRYYKPVKDLKVDTGESGCFNGQDGANRCKHTDEDTERYWLLGNPAFRDELASAGWMIFPEIEKVEEWESKRMGKTFSIGERYKREFKIRDFIKVMELVTGSNPEDQRDYSLAIKDFKELNPLGEDISFVWKAGSGYDAFFYMSAKHKDTTLPLILGEVKESFPDNERQTKNTLARAVLLDFEIPRTGHISTLIGDYAKQKGINYSGEWMKDEGLRVLVKDRQYGQRVESPNTPALLDQALDLKSFTQRVLQEEGKEVRAKEEAQLAEKRKKFGIEVTVK